MTQGIRVTVWNEGVHEREDAAVREMYPRGIGGTIARALEGQPGIASVRVAQLNDPGQGLGDDILDHTDVMTWWGHRAHDQVTEENAARVQQRVLDGMGLIVLHSGHFSKPFIRLMGTSCKLKWREWKDTGERERLWAVDPAHPVAHGLPECFEVEHAEMYGEHFDVPPPDQLVFISWFQGGEVFRSGCAWHRGQGKIFYFRPGHETFDAYHNPHVLHVIANAARWAAPVQIEGGVTRRNTGPLENMDG